MLIWPACSASSTASWVQCSAAAKFMNILTYILFDTVTHLQYTGFYTLKGLSYA